MKRPNRSARLVRAVAPPVPQVPSPHVQAGHAQAREVAVPEAPRRVALVTEELSSSTGSGGIGGAFHELAIALAHAGHSVDIVFVPIDDTAARRAALQTYYSAHGIRVLDVPFADYVWPPLTAERKAYGLFCYLRSLETGYDFIHFHDYKGLGFYTLGAKRQGLGFGATTMVIQAHGPTRWTLEANGHPFSHEDQLKIDFMERESIARADILVSPSQYLLDWFDKKCWQLPNTSGVHVIQNLCSHLAASATRHRTTQPAGLQYFDEIVFFGRHEERKGVVEFCDALDELALQLENNGTTVTFLGRFGEVNSAPSALYLAGRAVTWRFPLRILPDYGRTEAAEYLSSRPGALVVVASPVENSPYSVLEAVALGKPLVTSSEGGAGELLDDKSVAAMTCEIANRELAAKLRDVLANGLPQPNLAIAPDVTLGRWLALHQKPVAHATLAALRIPTVVVGIVHHDRPEKLVEAVLSIAAQTYAKIEIVVIDDGSTKPATIAALKRLQPLFDKLGVRLIRQANLYLGAARNRIVRETKSDYVLFLDDDDIAFPTMVQMLVTAAVCTGSAVVNCLNLFMEENRRSLAFPFPDQFEQKVSYLPLGGPLAMAPLENCFGSATALIRRDAFDAVGGYTEIYGVGHEDYELYLRVLQQGERIEICPLPLYLYEVGRPSMISNTSRQKNFARVANAVDPASFGKGAASDLCSLLAGRRASEHTENFRAYSISISPDPERLRQILTTPSDHPAYPDIVAAYARTLGSENFAAACTHLGKMRATATHSRGTSTQVPVWPGRLVKIAPALRFNEPLLLGALVDAECGRLHEAVSGFLLSVSRNSRIGPCGLRVLQICAEAQGMHHADIVRLNQAIVRLTLSGPEFHAAAPALMRLAVAAEDGEMLFAISERALQADEEHYLALYPDVAAALTDGTFSSGLMHFSSRREENRAGFDLSGRLCTMLAPDPAEMGPERLRGHVLERAKRAALYHDNRPALLMAAE